MPVLLNTAYFPPVEYFALMARDIKGVEGTLSSTPSLHPAKVYIEACENYQKQSYRNRCHFMSASGKDSLSFPIVHTGGSHNNIPITEVLVDYSVDWVTRHKRAIESAYRMSAYFEYYCDGIFSILDSRPETLFSINWEITSFFISKFGLPVELLRTQDFSGSGSGRYGDDYREKIHPKRPDSILAGLGLEKPYYQVFSGKYGFIPNLSAMDLLFNEGPESVMYLIRQ